MSLFCGLYRILFPSSLQVSVIVTAELGCSGFGKRIGGLALLAGKRLNSQQSDDSRRFL